MLRIPLIVFFMLCQIILSASAQVEDQQYYDDTTRQLYKAERWEELLQMSNKAIDSGFESYSLRLRLGVAHYRMQNYRMSILQLTKARSLNHEDTAAIKYLYSAYHYSGRSDDALFLYGRNRELLKEEIKRSNRFVQSIYLEGAAKLSSGSREVGNMYFGQGGIKLRVLPFATVYQSYSYVWQDLSAWYDADGLPSTDEEVEFEYEFKQHQYYIKPHLVPATGWRVTPAFHLLWVDAVNTEMTDWLAYIGVEKEVGLFSFLLGGSYSELNKMNQKQVTAGFSFYPKGNFNIYSSTKFVAHFENDNQETILNQRVGVKVFNHTWMEGLLSLGNIRNYQEAHAMYIYNALDTIESRFGILITRELGRHLLYLNYTLENKMRYRTGDKFNHHSIAAGLNFNL